MNKATAVYLRVSTNQQTTASQEHDLDKWADGQTDTVRWFRDSSTGADYDRKGWQECYEAIRRGEIGSLVVWRLDRLGRTAGQTITLLDELDALGIKLISLKDGFDSSTPTGRLLRNLLACFAEYEREVRKERQSAGIAAARAKGKVLGGRKAGTRITVTVEKEKAIHELTRTKGVSEVARLLKMSRSTIYKVLKDIQNIA